MKKNKNQIIASLIIIWIIGSIVGFAFAMQSGDRQWLGLVLLGQLLFVAGIAVTVSLIRDKQNSAPIGVLFILVGGILLVCGLLLHFGNEETKHTLNSLFPVFFGGIFLLVGLTGLIAPIVWKKQKEKKCATPVEAICIARKEKTSGKRVLIDPVYRITWNGEQYELNNYVFHSCPVPEVGGRKTLYIDENDIDGYFDPDEYASEKVRRIVMRIIFGGFVAFGGLALFLFFCSR